MIEIDIDIKNALKDIQDLKNKTSDMTPLMARLSDIMHEAVTDNFQAEGRPKWKELSPLTIKRRKKMGYENKPILQNSGTLSRLEPHFGRDSAIVGTNVEYARIHQFGGPAGRGKKVNIPARPYLTLGDEALGEIEDAVAKWLNKE